jgi:glycosyltransferase involved in cell wall biosynthesis
MDRDASAPRISVVIPAYNNAEHIAATLDAVLGQDEPSFEVVIADHSSSDDTAAIIARYAGDERLVILPPTPKGGGALANWNRVTENARGRYLKLVCGDDLITPEAIREQADVLDAHPEVALVACQRSLIDTRGEEVIARRGLQGLSGTVDGAAAVRRSVVAGTNVFGEPACVMFRRELLAEEGGWDNSFPYLIDQASYARVLKHGRFYALRKVQASFRISATQWSVRLVRQQAAQAQGFHARARAERPDVISAFDLAWGDLRALVNGYARRMVYWTLKHRM